MPKLSIIIPLYNKEKDIKNTLSSVLAQSFNDFEIIIINDGSTDASEEVVKSIFDQRIILFSKKNEGVSYTRNFGVEQANTNNIVFLDADDYWYPNHLKNIYSLITKFPNHFWFATAYEKKHNVNLITPMSSPVMDLDKNWMGVIPNYFKYSLIDCLAWTSAVCMKKDFFNSLNGFDTTITHGAGEDTDLWIRAVLKSPLVFSNTISARHNLDGSNRISNTPTLKRKYMNLDNYENESNNNYFLKKYLDLNRYSIALQYKLANDLDTFKNYTEKIELTNLNKKQRFLLKQNKTVLKLFVMIQVIFGKYGLDLSSFK